MTTLADEMRSELTELENKFEKMVFEFLQEDKSAPLSDEIMHFGRTRLGWDDKKIREHRRRISTVFALRDQAMSQADRDRLQKRLDEAKAALDADGPALEEQIGELTKKLEALRQAPAKYEAILSQVRDALEKLEKVIPPSVVREISRIKVDCHELKKNRNEVQTMVEHLRHVLANQTDIDVVQSYEKSETRLQVDQLDSIAQATPLVVESPIRRGQYSYTLSGEAPAHFRKAEKFLPLLEEELARLNAAVETAEAPVRKLRCYYHN